MDPYYNKQVMLGNRALSILSQENYPVEDKPTIINYRQPSEVDEDIEDDYGIVGYMGEDEDIEQAKYDVMSMLSDQFTGFDNRIESMKQQLEDINRNITNQSSVIQDYIYSESSRIQYDINAENDRIRGLQGEIHSESSAIRDYIYSESSRIQYDINAENDRIRGLQREIHSESSVIQDIQGEIYSESSAIQDIQGDINTILERYSRGQVCSPPCSPNYFCFNNRCVNPSSQDHPNHNPDHHHPDHHHPDHTPTDPCASAPCLPGQVCNSSTNPDGYICSPASDPRPTPEGPTSEDPVPEDTETSTETLFFVGVVLVAIILIIIRRYQIYETAEAIGMQNLAAQQTRAENGFHGWIGKSGTEVLNQRMLWWEVPNLPHHSPHGPKYGGVTGWAWIILSLGVVWAAARSELSVLETCGWSSRLIFAFFVGIQFCHCFYFWSPGPGKTVEARVVPTDLLSTRSQWPSWMAYYRIIIFFFLLVITIVAMYPTKSGGFGFNLLYSLTCP